MPPAYGRAVEPRYTIGQLAVAAGVPASTIRYYERRRLLPSAARAGPGRYRCYGRAELDRLRFIRVAQQLGFALEDIAQLLAFVAGGPAPCADVRDVIAARLADVSARRRALRRVERTLRDALAACRRQADGDCATVREIAAASRGARHP
jgi:MerR family mercuric resistance operon transcriptional regulator